MVVTLAALAALPGEAVAQSGQILPQQDSIETIVTKGVTRPVAMYARVYIRGQKMVMQVDTGAASTVIDRRVSRKVGLAAYNGKLKTRSIGCTKTNVAVQIDDWKVGQTVMPSVKAIAEKFPGKLQKVHGLPVAGLLGADALSFFQTVGIDFPHSRMLLNHPFAETEHTFPVRTVFSEDTGRPTLMVADVQIHGRRTRMAIDTGASATTVDRSIAKRARLKKVGRRVKVRAVGCTTTVQPVRLNRWSVGGRRVPDTIAAKRRTGLPRQTGGLLSGLIGADILARYGLVTLDYKQLRVSFGFPKIGVSPEG